MSGFRGMGGVSSTLRNLLRDRMEQPVDVTIAPPDVAIPGVNRRVNLYLYQVSENGWLKNQEIPGQGHPADYGHPPLSLNLYYLMTCFGGAENALDSDLGAQQILGDAMRVFHDFSIVTDTLHEGDNPAAPLILDPNLVGEFEKVKVTLQPATIDDFSKIWTALPQANFRRSVAYEVSVVQIAAQRPRRSALPVRERRVYAFPLSTPRIQDILRDPPFDGVLSAVAEVNDTIRILGVNLSGAGVQVRLGDLPPIPIVNPQDTVIALTVPNNAVAGLNAVQVIRDFLLDAEPGQPPVPHHGFESNAFPLMVIPKLVGITPDPVAPGAVVTVTVDPPALARQAKLLLVGDDQIPAEPVDPASAPSATIDFRLPSGFHRIPAGPHLVRVRVDGAESRLTIDPVTHLYSGPTVTVT
jgi:hypothetical protein